MKEKINEHNKEFEMLRLEVLKTIDEEVFDKLKAATEKQAELSKLLLAQEDQIKDLKASNLKLIAEKDQQLADKNA